MHRAINSLPTPVSPWIRTVASVVATARRSEPSRSTSVLSAVSMSNIKVTFSFAPDALNGFGFETSTALRVDPRLGPHKHNGSVGSVSGRTNTLASELTRQFFHALNIEDIDYTNEPAHYQKICAVLQQKFEVGRLLFEKSNTTNKQLSAEQTLAYNNINTSFANNKTG